VAEFSWNDNSDLSSPYKFSVHHVSLEKYILITSSRRAKNLFCQNVERVFLVGLFFCGIGFVLAKQALYYLSHTSSPFLLWLLF
jgi:hypothetical protein